MWFDGKLVVRIIDVETNFQNAIIISGKTNHEL